MFYTQSAVRSPHIIPSPSFIPSPQSVVRSPQSVFYTDRNNIQVNDYTIKIEIEKVQCSFVRFGPSGDRRLPLRLDMLKVACNWPLLYGHVSRGLETNKVKNLIG